MRTRTRNTKTTKTTTTKTSKKERRKAEEIVEAWAEKMTEKGAYFSEEEILDVVLEYIDGIKAPHASFERFMARKLTELAPRGAQGE
jgi:hypothetical protein